MVRWNAGTEHVKTQRQTLSPAGLLLVGRDAIETWHAPTMSTAKPASVE
jgi:hypothetical protein